MRIRGAGALAVVYDELRKAAEARRTCGGPLRPMAGAS